MALYRTTDLWPEPIHDALGDPPVQLPVQEDCKTLMASSNVGRKPTVSLCNSFDHCPFDVFLDFRMDVLRPQAT